jgi:hypothetical protein
VAWGDAKVFCDGLDDLVASAAAELAWCLSNCQLRSHIFTMRNDAAYRRAKLNKVFANRLTVVHCVEGCDFVDAHRGHLEDSSDFIHDADACEAVLTLAEVQQRHDGCLLVLRGVAGDDFLDELFVLFGELEGNGRVVLGGVAVLFNEC